MAITIVVACVSTAFWQWQLAGDRVDAEAEGTVQAIEYVRQGSVVNMPLLTVTFEDQAGQYAVRYQSDSDPAIKVGDTLTLRYDAVNPQAAIPAAEVAADMERRRSFAIFSGLVAIVALLAALAGHLEGVERIRPDGPIQPLSTG